MSISPTIFIRPMQTCIQHEAVDLLYTFVHSSSLVFKYMQGYGPNGLQATTTTRASCSLPINNNAHHTQKYSYDACKSVFRVKRMLSSIHWCIHHDLFPDIMHTGGGGDTIITAEDEHFVSYKHMDTNKFMHPPSLVSKHREKYGQNSLQTMISMLSSSW
jgi:hypothetical protein